jgi:hypothetical protein
MTTSRTRKSPTPRKAPAKKASKSGSSGAEGAESGTTSPAKSGATGTTGRDRASAPRSAAKPRPSAGDIAQEALRQLIELVGKEAEGVAGLERSDDGWRVLVEMVEVRRIPSTTDVMSLYEVNVDEGGALEGYRRLRRYARGVPGED